MIYKNKLLWFAMILSSLAYSQNLKHKELHEYKNNDLHENLDIRDRLRERLNNERDARSLNRTLVNQLRDTNIHNLIREYKSLQLTNTRKYRDPIEAIKIAL